MRIVTTIVAIPVIIVIPCSKCIPTCEIKSNITLSLDKNSDFMHVGNVYRIGQNFYTFHLFCKNSALSFPLPNV